MKVCILCSGSKGNCVYVETSKYKILLDAGKNYKYISSALNKINVSIKDINYILISHTHTDHISSLKEILNKSNAILCVSQKIFYEMKNINDFERINIFEDNIRLDNLNLESFRSSHDSVDSRNFIIKENNQKISYITDTGYINNRNFEKIYDSDVILMESNHDVEMLENGPYPEWLKSRILSDNGHLSNNSAGFYLTKLIGPHTKKVFLIHLSEVNNSPCKALETVNDMLAEYNVVFNNISCAQQDDISEVITID